MSEVLRLAVAIEAKVKTIDISLRNYLTSMSTISGPFSRPTERVVAKIEVREFIFNPFH